ncbi:hypothetical protein [Streptomyces sp. 8N616]
MLDATWDGLRATLQATGADAVRARQAAAMTAHIHHFLKGHTRP